SASPRRSLRHHDMSVTPTYLFESGEPYAWAPAATTGSQQELIARDAAAALMSLRRHGMDGWGVGGHRWGGRSRLEGDGGREDEGGSNDRGDHFVCLYGRPKKRRLMAGGNSGGRETSH